MGGEIPSKREDTQFKATSPKLLNVTFKRTPQSPDPPVLSGSLLFLSWPISTRSFMEPMDRHFSMCFWFL